MDDLHFSAVADWRSGPHHLAQLCACCPLATAVSLWRTATHHRWRAMAAQPVSAQALAPSWPLDRLRPYQALADDRTVRLLFRLCALAGSGCHAANGLHTHDGRRRNVYKHRGEKARFWPPCLPPAAQIARHSLHFV